MNIEEIEAELTKACEEIIKRGWKIVPGGYMSKENKTCCVYDALIMVKDLDVLTCDAMYVEGFVAGFDGGRLYHPSEAVGYELGKKFRAKYVGWGP